MFAVTERRIAAEWLLLQQLVQANPARLSGLRAESASFHVRLHGPVAVSIPNGNHGPVLFEHDLRIDFPVHFPAVPMEMYLATPVAHPNVHPASGFVCLWERHRVSNTVEIAMHKLVAMLAGLLWNGHAPHVMQPEVIPCAAAEPMPLRGVSYEPHFAHPAAQAVRRRRLL